MALIPIRVDRTSKPPVGTPLRSDGHWSVQGLELAYGGNGAFDAHGALGGLSGFSTTRNFGQGLLLNGTTQLLTFFSPTPKLTHFTAIAGIIPSTLKTYSAIISTRSSLNSGWSLRNAQNDGYRLGFTLHGASDHTSTIPSIPPGNYGVVGLVYTDLNGIIFNGTTGQSQSIATGSQSAANMVGFSLGATTKSGPVYNDFFPGMIIWLVYYNRPLSIQERESISANPWQIYEPETIWITVGGSGEQVAAFLDSAALSEAIAATVIRLAASTESMAVTTAESATLTTSVSATETLVVGESLSAGALITSATIEVIAASEASVSIKVTSSVLAESTGAGEVFAATKATSSTLTETSLTSEVISATKATISIIAESSGTTETLSATFSISSSTTESVSPADALSAIVGGIMAACTDSLSLAETQAVTLASSVAIGESGATSDATTAIAQRPVAVSELSALSDLRGGIISTGAAISEAAGATDEQNTLSITDAAIAESGATADNLTITITTAGSGISWELMVAAVQAGLTAQGLTISRIEQIDNLDMAVSTRATPADVPAATVNAAAVWSYER